LSDIETLIATSRPINIHIKVNTGMNRYGFSSLKELKRALNLIKCSNLHLEGVFTHFATADEHVDLQMKKFYKYLRLLKDYNFSPIIHADNSFVSETKNHHLDMVRIGFNLYNRESHWYVPAVEIRSTIVDVKTVKKGDLVGYDYRFVAHGSMRVAILPIGYADGFDIRYIGADIIVGDTKCRVLNICMDCFMLDISNTDLKKGDEISIIDKSNSLKYFANYSRTSEYEVMTKFSHMRAVRIVV